MNSRIAKSKLKPLLLLHRQGYVNKRQTAKVLNISRTTLKRYLSTFDEIRDLHPQIYQDDLAVFDKIYVNNNKVTLRYEHLHKLFPGILEHIKDEDSDIRTVWKKYRVAIPTGYSYSQFLKHFSTWLKTQGTSKIRAHNWRIKKISTEDLKLLKKWRRSKDKRKWERAVVLLESYRMMPITHISKKVERSDRIVKKWILDYKRDGISALFAKERKLNTEIAERIMKKKENLIKLLHETPHLHGINRASWSLKSLSEVYERVYGISFSVSSISSYIRSLGYSFRRAKKTLTSPDPLYREKLKKITSILSKLTVDERFFSIDEFGPFAVKMQGGRSFVKAGKIKVYPQRQKSKGSIICTAALELSTNQITHFYSEKKNTTEMIKLLEVLLEQYSSVKQLYFSWDAASWHASKDLYDKIKEVNSNKYRLIHNTPIVELAPLPSSAQFLNVIESVFSGMVRAIIHNSNYQSVKACKAAIDQYFTDRNEYFKTNPKRAGKKIWGKELVKSEFSESHNCKDPKYR